MVSGLVTRPSLHLPNCRVFGLSQQKKRKLSAALLLDLSAAFDVVDRNILIEKLKLYGLSNQAVEWFKSYLEDHCQHVMVDSQLSCPISVGEQGVPQGSLLGPLCFLIFYNDFPAIKN